MRRRLVRPRSKTKRCEECGRRRGWRHIEWHPGCLQWQCSDDVGRCKELFQALWSQREKSYVVRGKR